MAGNNAGIYNVAVGASALTSNGAGGYNTAIGSYALSSSSTSS